MTELSKEYAQALFMLAKEISKEKEYEEALSVVEIAIKENPEYLDFLSSPQVPIKERLSALDEAFSASLPEHVLSFVKLLCERGHILSFEPCRKEYKKILDFYEQRTIAYVKSALDLTEEEKVKLKDKLEKMSGRSVLLECSVDKSLMGGMIVEMDGKVIDGSIKHHLHKVKDVISR
ncbi:MAG: ATP synthase F1 subunit delta [Clostridia bacterium]|nr:ATP synthase F1 subunit delta [Clostridia bacterium]MBR6647480.1 ATP synthase F1 subunit delta [Clostridia bacterium]